MVPGVGVYMLIMLMARSKTLRFNVERLAYVSTAPIDPKRMHPSLQINVLG